MGKIVVFGGVHIDILADYEEKNQKRLDRVGELYYSIGGTAYNIAQTLASHKQDVTLYSVLSSNSFSTVWIKREISNTNIKAEFQMDSAICAENGFVALRKNGVLEHAVTSSSLSRVQLDTKQIISICKNKSLAVIDSNFESHQIMSIVKHCKNAGLRIIVAATSDSKVKRILPVLDHYQIDVMVMNAVEAKVFFDKSSIEDITAEDIPQNVKSLIITNSSDGHYVFESGKRIHFMAPYVADVLSTSGAGDALTASVAQHLSQKQSTIDWDECNKTICEYVGECLTQKTTYIHPTKKKLPVKKIVIWGCVATAIVMTIFICYLCGMHDVGMILSIVGTILAFGQIFRGEMSD
ncbi:MAG: hypothetical protein J6V49_03570 [Bacteroidales bacterium]|nr:hypothetical protein [Bacteroidales bacterium]MBO7183194.1 hypothetical protein [Bacteroidales bacterium]